MEKAIALMGLPPSHSKPCRQAHPLTLPTLLRPILY